MRSRAPLHAREETFRATPHRVRLAVLDSGRDVPVAREEVAPGCYLLHRLMSPGECRRLIAAAAGLGFSHAGLAVGGDTYRVNLAVRNNLRVVIDEPDLSAALWGRLRAKVDPGHEGAALAALNWRFRVYEYNRGQRYFPHVDVRTALPGGETRFSLVIYLNDGFEGGATRFFERKDKASRRGEGRGRKFDNRVTHALRPPVGSAVVFDHLLLHEGAEVTAGVKYAVRSDLIYR
jgi:prolyl 4-hydroxylase